MPEALGRTDMRDVRTKMRNGNMEMPRKVISGANVGRYSVSLSEQNANSGETGGLTGIVKQLLQSAAPQDPQAT